MASEVVAYQLDDSSVVRFEVDLQAGFHPAGGGGKTAGRVQDAIRPAVEAAKEVLDKVKEVGPDEVEVTFGVKVSGGMDWLIARAASEANFEIKLTWRPAGPGLPGPAAGMAGGERPAAPGSDVAKVPGAMGENVTESSGAGS
jgi:hypothetical protein